MDLISVKTQRMRFPGYYFTSVLAICIFSLYGFGGEVAEDVGNVPAITPSATPTPNVSEIRPRLQSVMTMKERERMGRFGENLGRSFKLPSDEIEALLLREYGAIFVGRGGAMAPATVVFRDHVEVAAFQKSLELQTESIGGMQMTLQAVAMKSLVKAIDEADRVQMTITPRDTDAASRRYDETVILWASRVEPALDYWVGKQRITMAEAERIRRFAPYEQVGEILRLEKQGIYFAKDLSKSIIYSVAPPGASQHLSMLAFDIAEHDDERVRKIMERHGWFQTVVSDLPHFTFLGVEKAELKKLGLKKIKNGGRTFWVPDI